MGGDWARLPILLAAALSACDACPPPDPDGAGPDSRAEVRAAVWDFYEALGPTRICVTSLDLEASDERAGHYRHGFQDIAVDPSSQLGAARVATHELCHALDDQHHVRWEQDNLWRYDPPRTDIEPKWHMGEAFADTCEVGPLSVQLVGPACDGDIAGSRAYKVLQDWFVVPDTGLSSTAYRFEERGSWTVHMPVRELEARGMAGGAVRLDVRTQDGRASLVLDVATGEPSVAGLPIPSPEVDMPAGWVPVAAAGDPDQAVVVAALRSVNGGLVRRLLAVDETGVQSLGCTRPHEVPFEAGGLYTVWADGAVLHWGEWIAEQPSRSPGRPGGVGERPAR